LKSSKTLYVIVGLLHYSKELIGGFIPTIQVVIYYKFRKRSVSGEDMCVHHHTPMR